MKEYKIDANLHIVSFIEANNEDEAKNMFLAELEYDGELYGGDINITDA